MYPAQTEKLQSNTGHKCNNNLLIAPPHYCHHQQLQTFVSGHRLIIRYNEVISGLDLFKETRIFALPNVQSWPLSHTKIDSHWTYATDTDRVQFQVGYLKILHFAAKLITRILQISNNSFPSLGI